MERIDTSVEITAVDFMLTVSLSAAVKKSDD
jgi:hypothetical protein